MILSALAGWGLDFVMDLVKDNGEDLVNEGIKKVTGIDLSKKQELSQDDILKIKAAEFKIKQLDFEELKLQFKNTDSARKMNSEIQTSENASPLAKNAAYYIDFAIIGSTITVGLLLFMLDIPDANKELAYMMFGSLMTLSGTIINFHRGSTQGSKDKTTQMAKMGK
jgi:hypothetical protein